MAWLPSRGATAWVGARAAHREAWRPDPIIHADAPAAVRAVEADSSWAILAGPTVACPSLLHPPRSPSWPGASSGGSRAEAARRPRPTPRCTALAESGQQPSRGLEIRGVQAFRERLEHRPQKRPGVVGPPLRGPQPGQVDRGAQLPRPRGVAAAPVEGPDEVP